MAVNAEQPHARPRSAGRVAAKHRCAQQRSYRPGEPGKKLERENYLLTVLYEAGKALNSKLALDHISEQVVSLAFLIEGVERGFVMLFDEAGEVTRQSEVRYR